LSNYHKAFKHVIGFKHQSEYVNFDFGYLVVNQPHVLSWAIVNTSEASLRQIWQ